MKNLMNEFGVYVQGLTKVTAKIKSLGEVEFRYIEVNGKWLGAVSMHYSTWGQSSPVSDKSKKYNSFEDLIDSLYMTVNSKLPQKDFESFKKILDEQMGVEKKGQMDLFIG